MSSIQGMITLNDWHASLQLHSMGPTRQQQRLAVMHLPALKELPLDDIVKGAWTAQQVTPALVQICDCIAKLNTAHFSLSGQVGVPSLVCSLGDGTYYTLFRCLLSAQTCMHDCLVMLTRLASWFISLELMGCAAMHCSNSAYFAVLTDIVSVFVRLLSLQPWKSCTWLKKA